MDENKENNTTPHWCAELFPPTFTHKDVLEVSSEEKRRRGGLPKDYYTGVYSQIVLEEEMKKKKKTRVKTVLPLTTSFEAYHNQDKLPENELSPVIDPLLAAVEPSKTDDNLWTGDELQLFRKAYTKLKEKAVKLLCVIETKNLKINEIKRENAFLKKQLKQKDKTITDLAKEKTVLQGYAKSHEKICDGLEYKLQFYEDCNNDLKEVLLRKDEELRKTKCELRNQNETQKQDNNNVEKINRVHKLELLSLEETLKGRHERDIAPLRKEIDSLTTCKQSCEEECVQFKNSFLDLQRHFMEGSILSSQRRVDMKGGKEFIGIADMG